MPYKNEVKLYKIYTLIKVWQAEAQNYQKKKTTLFQDLVIWDMQDSDPKSRPAYKERLLNTKYSLQACKANNIVITFC